MTIRELSRERAALIKARVELQNRRDTITSSVVRKINALTIATLTIQIKKIEQEIKACISEDEDILAEIHIMTTMPGVNFVSAYSILAEIGSLKQYSAKELSAISGLAPRIRQSGSSVHSSFMSRRSSGRLRQILYLDSVPGVPKIPVLQEFQQRLLAKGKKRMTVRCACMRKMLLMLRSMVVHNSSFADERPANTGQDIRKEVRIPNRRNVFRRTEHRETFRRPFIPKLTDEGPPKSLDFPFPQDYIKL